MLNKKIIDTIFWNSYATAYDDIAKYYKPYKVLINSIIAFIKKKLKKGKIFDAGCGTGELSARLAEKDYELDALDISKVMLDVLQKKIVKKKLKRIKIRHGDLNRKLPYKKNKFDVVINVHSLFMLDNIWFTLSELNRVLKKKGYLIIAHHKSVELGKAIKEIIKTEGIICGFRSLFRLFKVGFFNIFLSRIHRKIYGDINIESIVNYMRKKGALLLLKKTLYNGFDDLVVFKK